MTRLLTIGLLATTACVHTHSTVPVDAKALKARETNCKGVWAIEYDPAANVTRFSCTVNKQPPEEKL